MPEFVKAELREISWLQNQPPEEINPDKTVKVQFNPETLKLAYSNQKAGGDQRGGSASQFVGKGTTRLTLELWFDVTTPLPEDSAPTVNDVRKLTEKVNYFMKPKPQGRDKWLPPGVRFVWGTFLFDGVMDSINETLEYFSDDGKPLRAMLSITLSSQEILFEFNPDAAAGGRADGSPVGTQPMEPARAGDSVQQMASRAGKPNQWKDIAAANKIENPRNLAAGLLIKISVE